MPIHVPKSIDFYRFNRFIKCRVESKKCPIHHKSARISVNHMNYKITSCCCLAFETSLKKACEKYKIGILLGKYNFVPKKRLSPLRQNRR